jgi:glycerophosphoryl diester phosphodiesterase
MLSLAVLPLGAAAAHRVQVHGHRGARAARPENTIPAFQYAIAAGVDALELDMAVTKDKVIVVSHDPVLEAPVCTGPQPKAVIHQLTLKQVKQWDCGATQNPKFPRQRAVPGTRMPALDEVFDLASQGDFLFNIETKSFPQHPELTPPPDEFARMVLEKIRKHHLEKRVVLQSFDYRTLHAMKRLAPEIKLSALYEGPSRDFVQIAHEAGAQIISPEYHLVTEQQVKAAHAAGLEVLPWTPDEQPEWNRLVKAGVDGIITDDPAALIAFLKTNQVSANFSGARTHNHRVLVQ